MPWDMKDYPNSFKNFDHILRKKMIEIGNALLADGYPDERAIPIAISEAKKWYKDASAEEKRSFNYGPTPKKTDSHDTSDANPRLLTQAVTVKYVDDHWAVETKGAKRADSDHKYKQDAVERAREIAKNKGTSVEVYTKEGKKERIEEFKDQ